MTSTPGTNGTAPEWRDGRGRFVPGNPGGPGGSKRRSVELRRAAEEAITPEHIQAMIRKATRMALEGNLTAMRFVIERTSGRAPEAPVELGAIDIDLPALHTAADCNRAVESLVNGICAGELDRESARLLLDAVQTRLKAIELSEVEQRLSVLERVAVTLTPTDK